MILHIRIERHIRNIATIANVRAITLEIRLEHLLASANLEHFHFSSALFNFNSFNSFKFMNKKKLTNFSVCSSCKMSQ